MTKRAVRVYEIPGQLSSTLQRSFLNELRQHTDTERPRFVIDCNQVADMDGNTIHLLLSCLEEAMKSNGDVRLSSLAPHAELALEAAGINRLFEIFHSAEGAIQSFQQRSTSRVLTTSHANRFRNDQEVAA